VYVVHITTVVWVRPKSHRVIFGRSIWAAEARRHSMELSTAFQRTQLSTGPGRTQLCTVLSLLTPCRESGATVTLCNLCGSVAVVQVKTSSFIPVTSWRGPAPSTHQRSTGPSGVVMRDTLKKCECADARWAAGSVINHLCRVFQL
jgi:hypothetical protein